MIEAGLSQGHLEIIKLLVASGAKINVTDEYGRTLLFSAVGNRRLRVLPFLLNLFSDLNVTDLLWANSHLYACT